MFGNTASNKSNIYERDWSKFGRENFVLDFFPNAWVDLMKINELNVDNSNQMYLEQINILLDTYAPLKRIEKYKLRFAPKPWITLGFQKSISLRNKLLTKFINTKVPLLNKETHIECKTYRNLLSFLMKKGKQAYYNKYFETNWTHIKNTEWNQISNFFQNCSFHCTNCALP